MAFHPYGGYPMAMAQQQPQPAMVANFPAAPAPPVFLYDPMAGQGRGRDDKARPGRPKNFTAEDVLPSGAFPFLFVGCVVAYLMVLSRHASNIGRDANGQPKKPSRDEKNTAFMIRLGFSLVLAYLANATYLHFDETSPVVTRWVVGVAIGGAVFAGSFFVGLEVTGDIVQDVNSDGRCVASEEKQFLRDPVYLEFEKLVQQNCRRQVDNQWLQEQFWYRLTPRWIHAMMAWVGSSEGQGFLWACVIMTGVVFVATENLLIAVGVAITLFIFVPIVVGIWTQGYMDEFKDERRKELEAASTRLQRRVLSTCSIECTRVCNDTVTRLQRRAWDSCDKS